MTAALGGAACNEIGVRRPDPEPPVPLAAVLDSFVQAPLPSLDILVVVDDTASMAQEQAALAGGFAALVDGLTGADVAWQIGVTTTDMSASEAGWLFGSPYVLGPSTEGAAALLEALVQPGVTGATPEAGLAAASRALELAVPGGANTGFRRPGAGLHVVVVSDADDGSADWLGPDPVAAFLDVLAAQDVGDGSARLSAIVGDVPTGCTSELGTAQPGTAYAEVAAATGGVFASICAVDFGELLDAVAQAALVWPVEFPLREAPEPSSLRISVDGVRVEEGFSLVLEPSPSVVFDEPPAPGARIEIWYLVPVEQEGA